MRPGEVKHISGFSVFGPFRMEMNGLALFGLAMGKCCDSLFMETIEQEMPVDRTQAPDAGQLSAGTGKGF